MAPLIPYALVLLAGLRIAAAQSVTLTLSDGVSSSVVLPPWPSTSASSTTTVYVTDVISSGMTTTTVNLSSLSITPGGPLLTDSFSYPTSISTNISVTATATATAVITSTPLSNTTVLGPGAAESSAYLSSLLSVETASTLLTSAVLVGNATGTGTATPSQYTGAASRDNMESIMALVGFCVASLIVL